MTPGHGRVPAEQITDTERAVHGEVTLPVLHAFLSGWAHDRLGSAIAEVRFRAGRIDAVWGVGLQDGRAVVIKAHRTPVDVDAAQATVEAQRTLVTAGFPCPVPLAGPEELDGRVLTAESMMEGDRPNGRDRDVRRMLAGGLAQQIQILRTRPDLIPRAGAGPSWCRYQSGPWPVPHDTIVDLDSPLAGFEWIDAFGRRAAEQIIHNRASEEIVVGHADWYAGNTAVLDKTLVGTFDWELLADTEGVIAGFVASSYASSATGGGGSSTPDEAVAFLLDYQVARGRPLSEHEWRTAAGAASWILAFNARWQAALIVHGLCDQATIDLVHDHQEEYLALSRK